MSDRMLIKGINMHKNRLERERKNRTWGSEELTSERHVPSFILTRNFQNLKMSQSEVKPASTTYSHHASMNEPDRLSGSKLWESQIFVGNSRPHMVRSELLQKNTI